MRTFDITIHEKARNRTAVYTAEEFKFCDGRLWIYHRELGNVLINLAPYEELTISTGKEETE